MVLQKPAIAGTLESNDVMITIAPNAGNGITIDLDSVVKAQFGDSIRATVTEVLHKFEVADAAVTLKDRGALDCTIRARMACAICRAAQISYDWTKEDTAHA